LRHSNGLAVPLDNVVTTIAGDTIEIYGIVDLIAGDGIPPKINHKAFEALVTISAVAGPRIYGVYRCPRNVTCPLVVSQGGP
jgi:hypothetical protein